MKRAWVHIAALAALAFATPAAAQIGTVDPDTGQAWEQSPPETPLPSDAAPADAAPSDAMPADAAAVSDPISPPPGTEDWTPIEPETGAPAPAPEAAA